MSGLEQRERRPSKWGRFGAIAPGGDPWLMVAARSSRPLIAQRYRLLGVIGRGATGTVYRALDRLNERLVALKSLTPAFVPNAQGNPWDSRRA